MATETLSHNVSEQLRSIPEYPKDRVAVHLDTPDLSVLGLSSKDSQRIWRWNSHVPEPVSQCVHEIIREQCLRRPGDEAVCAWDGTITYGEVHRLSSVLARRIENHQLGPGSIIPVIMEKSRWIPICILGILKAGAAFVLLNPSHPSTRLENIMQQVKPPVVLASPLHTPLASRMASNVFTVRQEALPLEGDLEYQSPGWVSAQSLAFVVFTSGSSGAPKGALVHHESFCTAAMAYCGPLRITSSNRALQFASVAFDMAISDCLTTLMTGGCLCIPSGANVLDPAACIRHFKANWIFTTPSVARVIDPDTVPTLETLAMGGEAITTTEIALWSDRVNLVSAYSPSECSPVCCVLSEITMSTPQAAIGYPHGAVLWIIDPEDYTQLVAVGEVGELMYESYTVGRGYLNDPERTAAAFVDPPFWLQQLRNGNVGARLYKTGDLVRYLEDGAIQFVGRKDQQVKLRGQRIELGEVEHHLRKSFSSARDVFADVVTPAGRSPTLMAFIWQQRSADQGHLFHAPDDSWKQLARRVQSDLAKAIPVYMVPAVFLLIGEPPRTTTGKTDRRRLRQEAASLSRPELTRLDLVRASSKIPPDTAEERSLQHLWADVLQVSPDEIGVEDNFVHLGGDSIVAIKLASLSQSRGLNVSASSLIELGTIRKIVKRSTQSAHPLPAMTPKTNGGWVDPSAWPALACGHWFQSEEILDVLPLTEFQRRLLGKECDYMLFPVPPSVSRDRLLAGWRAVSRKHASVRSVFVGHQGEPVQIVLRDPEVPFVMIDCGDGTDAHEAARAVCKDVGSRPLPPGEQPLRVWLVESPHSRWMVCRLNHATYDDISLPVLTRDLSSAFRGDDICSAAKGCPDFPDYMRRRMAQQNPAAFDFWKRYLADSAMTLLPDLAPPPGAALSANTVEEEYIEVALPDTPPGITLATVLRAAWALVLGRRTQRQDVVFGQVVHGRDVLLPGIDQIVGALVSEVPFRVALQPGWTGLDLLLHVQHQQTRSMPYQAMDFGEIRDRCTSWPSTAGIQTMVLNVDMASIPAVTMDGTQCSVELVFPEKPDYIYIGCNRNRAEGTMGLFVCGSSQHLRQDMAVDLCKSLMQAMKELTEGAEDVLILPF